MTKKQKRFIEEYLVDLNATGAAIRAGYSPATATQIGYGNLEKPQIKAAIARIALVDPRDVFNPDEATINKNITDDDAATIASVKVKKTPTLNGEATEREIKLTDKIKALELLGKHFGMFTDRFDVTGGVDVKIVDDINENESD